MMHGLVAAGKKAAGINAASRYPPAADTLGKRVSGVLSEHGARIFLSNVRWVMYVLVFYCWVLMAHG
jgi:hypothetical protein